MALLGVQLRVGPMSSRVDVRPPLQGTGSGSGAIDAVSTVGSGLFVSSEHAHKSRKMSTRSPVQARWGGRSMPSAGIEPAALGLGIPRSIQLS